MIIKENKNNNYINDERTHTHSHLHTHANTTDDGANDNYDDDDGEAVCWLSMGLVTMINKLNVMRDKCCQL